MTSATLKPSSSLAVLLASAHCSAIALVLFLPIESKFWLVALLAFSMIHSIMRHALLVFPGSPLSLKMEEGSCTLVLRGGVEKHCTLLGSTYVSPFLTVLNLREKGKLLMRSIVILPDSVDREEFRKLRVWLRWKT